MFCVPSSLGAGEHAGVRGLCALLCAAGGALRLPHQVGQEWLWQLPGTSLLQGHRLQELPQVRQEVCEDQHVLPIY